MPRHGERREPFRARITQAERVAIVARAGAEADANASEMARRLMAYGLANMPPGWSPEGPDTAVVETTDGTEDGRELAHIRTADGFVAMRHPDGDPVRPRCSTCGQPSPCPHVRAVAEESTEGAQPDGLVGADPADGWEPMGTVGGDAARPRQAPTMSLRVCPGCGIGSYGDPLCPGCGALLLGDGEQR